MTRDTGSFAWLRDLAGIVGAEHVRPAGEADAIDGVRPEFVVEPATPSEVARVLAAATAAGKHVVPRGGGTKLDWGNPPRATDLVLSTKRLDRVLEHAAGDMTVTVEAGVTIEALQQTLAERGQRLALDPLWPKRATVGGVIATADSGPLRWAFGPVRDLVLGATVALADGTLARSGGKVVKNVAGYDLPKLLTGSLGTLGVIAQATLRLHPLPEAVRTLHFSLPMTDVVARFIAAMQDCALHVAAVQLCRQDDSTTADVRMEGPVAAIDAKLRRVHEAAIASGAVALTDRVPLEPWLARRRLFDEAGTPLLVARFGLLPAKLVFLSEVLADACGDTVRCRSVSQANGSGLIRLEADDPSELTATVTRLRHAIESLGGSLVVLHCAVEMKRGLDVWDDAGDALPLMRRIKNQFDPAGTLNPGRFAGEL